MVNCFAADCGHTIESDRYRYFRFSKEKDPEYKTWLSLCRSFFAFDTTPRLECGAAFAKRELVAMNITS